MANHTATKKAIRKTISKTAINKNRKTRIKTYVKRVLTAVESGDTALANSSLREAQSEIMSGVSKKLIKKTTGSRKVKLLAKKVKLLATGELIPKKTKKKTATKSTASKKTATTSAAAKKTTAPAKKVADSKTTTAKKVVKTKTDSTK